jgi:hypothetical protein
MSTETRSPLFIEVALHYWYSPTQWAEGHINSPASREIHERLYHAGLLETDVVGKYMCVREAMKPYVEALCAVPLPKQVWMIPSETP